MKKPSVKHIETKEENAIASREEFFELIKPQSYKEKISESVDDIVHDLEALDFNSKEARAIVFSKLDLAYEQGKVDGIKGKISVVYNDVCKQIEKDVLSDYKKGLREELSDLEYADRKEMDDTHSYYKADDIINLIQK